MCSSDLGGQRFVLLVAGLRKRRPACQQYGEEGGGEEGAQAGHRSALQLGDDDRSDIGERKLGRFRLTTPLVLDHAFL